MRFLQSRFTSLRLALSAALLAVSFAAGLSAGNSPVDLKPLNTLNPGYCPHAMTGTATYELATAATGTSSAVLDLGLVGCFSFSFTSNGGSVAQVWFTNSSNTYTANSLYGTALPGAYSVPKVARYVWFSLPANTVSAAVPGAPTQLSHTVTTGSIWTYLPSNWPN